MTRNRKLSLAIASRAFGLWLAPLGASAEATWNQERVTKIAQNLAEAATKLKNSLNKENLATVPIASERIRYEMEEDVRLLANTARHLARALEGGKTREATAPIVKRLGLLRRDAEENGRKAQITDSVMEEIFAVGSLLIQLAPYYNESEQE